MRKWDLANIIKTKIFSQIVNHDVYLKWLPFEVLNEIVTFCSEVMATLMCERNFCLKVLSR